MGEVTRAGTVQDLIVHPQLLEELGQDDATHGVDGIHAHPELPGLDRFTIHEFQTQHGIDVTLVIGVIHRQLSQLVHLGIVKVLCLCQPQHLCAISRCQELPLLVQELQGVPLSGVMRGGDDDTTISAGHPHGQLRRRCRGIADVDHIIAHAHERSYYYVTNHQARDTAITAHYYFFATDKGGVGCGKLHNIKGVQRVTGLTADGTANTGNRFY